MARDLKGSKGGFTYFNRIYREKGSLQSKGKDLLISPGFPNWTLWGKTLAKKGWASYSRVLFHLRKKFSFT